MYQPMNTARTNQYHLANYRGNQPGHDQYLRSDSNSPNNQQMQYGQMNNSFMQSRPAGSYVQSQYQGMQQNQQQFQSNPSFQQTQSPQQYHMANYRGNQPGHDQYLRSDSNSPNNQQMQYGQMNNSSMQSRPAGSFVQSQYQGMGMQQNQQFQSNPSFQQAQSPQQYHLANYRGNQPGHDQYLRSDSNSPNQQFQPMSGQGGYVQSQYSNQSFQQTQNPQQYHLANYRGNQPGHDQYLRSDSNSPNNQQMMFGQH